MSDKTNGQSESMDLWQNFIAEAVRELNASLQMIRHCVGQLNDEQVWWRPHEDMNSIGNLLLHLTGNLRQRLLSLIGGATDDRDRLSEFTARGPIPKAELLTRLEETVDRAYTLLASLTSARLTERRAVVTFAGTIELPVQAVVFRTLTHLAGHTQEIIQMTRAQLGETYVFQQPAGVPPRKK